MKKRLLMLTAICMFIMIVIVLIISYEGKQTDANDIKAGQIVALNEIEQLAKMGEYEKVADKVDILQNDISKAQADTGISEGNIVLMGVVSIIFLFVVAGYVYFSILRPFDKMKAFADEIACGNFDIPLDYERSNYFGEFTWAFDSMRREITKARSCEKEAIENNKTVIATLSHDIKTPIASIRAYAEGLEANLDATPEKRARYLNVLMRKCDEVSKLTNDLFLHSISDMDKLKISTEKTEICEFIENAVMEIAAEQNDIVFNGNGNRAMVSIDRNRMLQITENLINNARKYAKTAIDIAITTEDDMVKIHFHDYGEGIADEDIPFIFDKFYRGKNCGNEQGSGLGLYIVKYVVEQMNGKVMLYNHSKGLEVVVSLPVV